MEATAQLKRALTQIAALPATPALRGERIKFQVALAYALMNTIGHAAPETKASFDQARLYIEQAEALGEPPEDPLLLFSVLYGFWVANYIAFNSDDLLALAAEFLALAEKQGTMTPLMLGHRLMGTSLLCTGAVAEGRAHYDRAIAIYEPTEHRALATRFGQDIGVATLCYRSLALWLLGFPAAAGRDAEQALKEAREIGQAATLMYALFHTSLTHICCGDYATASVEANELVSLGDERGSLFWGSLGMLAQGCVLALTRKVSDAVHVITSGIIARRSTAATALEPFCLSYLAGAHAELDNFDDALHCIREAMTKVETTKEIWFEAEIKRMAGEIALSLPDPDATKAEEYFEHALAVARQQQAKSWELRAAVSMARLWYDQGKRQQAHDLLAPVYSWFTEGFETLDLKEARALLDELA